MKRQTGNGETTWVWDAIKVVGQNQKSTNCGQATFLATMFSDSIIPSFIMHLHVRNHIGWNENLKARKGTVLCCLNIPQLLVEEEGHTWWVITPTHPVFKLESSCGDIFCLWSFSSVRQAPVQERAGVVPISLRRRHLQGPQWDGGHHVKGNYGSASGYFSCCVRNLKAKDALFTGTIAMNLCCKYTSDLQQIRRKNMQRDKRLNKLCLKIACRRLILCHDNLSTNWIIE